MSYAGCGTNTNPKQCYNTCFRFIKVFDYWINISILWSRYALVEKKTIFSRSQFTVKNSVLSYVRTLIHEIFQDITDNVCESNSDKYHCYRLVNLKLVLTWLPKKRVSFVVLKQRKIMFFRCYMSKHNVIMISG